jgi:hypothetical protein
MTQLHPRPTTDPMLESLLRTARDRSARGNATRRDWQRVATIDRDLAQSEVREFLVRHGNTTPSTANPYERASGISGAVIGFVAGVALVAVTWLVLPWIRDTWISTPIWQHVITSGQFISTVFIPVGIYLGARWSQKRAGDEARHPAGIPKDATLEDLLDAFEKTQHAGRARVY